MSISRLPRYSILAVLALTPTLVFAHPGHEGGHGDGLTWDFAGEVLHRLTSPYHLAPVLAAAVLTLAALRLVSARRNLVQRSK